MSKRCQIRANKGAKKEKNPPQRDRPFMEVPPGFEPGIKVLQTFALPLGDGTVPQKNGAVDETRTRDLHLGKVALYQLSYYRLLWCLGAELNHRHCDFQSHALPTELPRRMAIRKGLEPSTSSVTGWHSNQLNYRTMWWEQQGSNL
jgi:hypothetical protein